MNKEEFILKPIAHHFDTKKNQCALLFTGKNYEILTLPYNHGHPRVFIRKLKSNEMFLEAAYTGESSCCKELHFSFQNVFSEHETHERFFDVYTDGEHAIILNKSSFFEFASIKEVGLEYINNLKYIPIPKSIIFEYAFIKDENLMFIVTRPEIHWNYENFNVYKLTQNGTHIEKLHLIDACRYRDGGTTEITTEEGFLYSPTSFSPHLKPYWQEAGDDTKIKLEEINLSENKFLIERLKIQIGVNDPLIKK